MTKNELITHITNVLKTLNVNKVILFGSYSKGEQTDNSDIDLLVITNDNFIFSSFAQKMETKLKIGSALYKLREFADIDLIVHTKPMFESLSRWTADLKKRLKNQDR